MLNNLGWMELLMLLLVGLLVFGPDQLPKIAGDLGRMLRQLRRMAKDVSSDLREELGPEFDDVDLASLHPRRFIAKHLMGDDDEQDGVPRRSRPAGSTEPAPTPTPTPGGAEAVPDLVPPYDADAT